VQRRTWSAIFLGGTLGAVFGLGVVALAAGRVVGSGIESLPILNEPARATFLVEQAALYIMILVAGAAAGALLTIIGFAVGRLGDPDDVRFPLGPLTIVGALVGAIVAFAVARAAIGVGGSISGGVISLSVFRAAMVALITGATTGVVIGGGVERLSRPQVLGFAGEAWPANPVVFMRDAMAAIGLPALGLVFGLAIVFGLSQVLLEADHTVSLITFGAVSALVLAGAAALAALPPRGGVNDESDG
jgi:hypothetical protein